MTGPNAMDEKTLKRLLRAERAEDDEMGSERFSGPFLRPAGKPLRPHFCPDEATLAAYVDHRIPAEKREQVETHLADCESCLGQVAFLVSRPDDPAAAVLPGVVARARELVAPVPSFWRPLVMRWGSAVAGIACVMLVVVAVLRPGATPPAPATPNGPGAAPVVQSAPPAAEGAPGPAVGAARTPAAPAVAMAPVATPPPPTVRKSARTVTAPWVVTPAEKATLARHDLEFRWQPVPLGLYYEINVVTDDGNVVWHARVEGTSARLPDGTKLHAGAKYFIWVKAFLTGGETVKSAAVSFQVADR